MGERTREQIAGEITDHHDWWADYPSAVVCTKTLKSGDTCNLRVRAASIDITLINARITTAIRAAVASETERCAGIADEYRSRMEAAVQRLASLGRSSDVAECKADAGLSIAGAIRAKEPT